MNEEVVYDPKRDERERLVLIGLLNTLCNTNYDTFTNIEDNGVNYCFACLKNGIPMEHIISKEYFDDAINIFNEVLSNDNKDVDSEK